MGLMCYWFYLLLQVAIAGLGAFLSYLWQIYHVSPGHACSKFHLLALAQALPWLPL